jgi:hypothetical protein
MEKRQSTVDDIPIVEGSNLDCKNICQDALIVSWLQCRLDPQCRTIVYLENLHYTIVCCLDRNRHTMVW